jgi:peptide deformylase
MDDGWEGCLSVPDMRGVVPRYTGVRLEAYGRDGERIDTVAKEFFARVIQHETDHLDGVLFFDRMTSLASMTFLDEYSRYWRKTDD